MVAALLLIPLMTLVPARGHEPDVASQAAAQTQKPAPKVDPNALPVSLDRIQRALAKTPRLIFDEQDRPIFRAEVFGETPSLEDILGPDWATGPVKHGSMTHREFLTLVTPKDVQGVAAFPNDEAATVAATSFLLQWALLKAIRQFNDSTDARAREAARREVLEALEALEKARARTQGRMPAH